MKRRMVAALDKDGDEDPLLSNVLFKQLLG